MVILTPDDPILTSNWLQPTKLDLTFYTESEFWPEDTTM